MMLVLGFWTFLRAVFFGSAAIALENVALRHQLLVLQRSAGRPRLARWDRILWVWLSRVWASWRASLVIVQPATVLAWHRQRLPALLAVDVQLIRITGPTLSSIWADSGDPFTHFDFWTLHDLPHQFTVEPNEADHLLWAGRRRLDEAAAWIHLGPAPPRHRGQPGFRQLRGLGVDRTLQARVQEPGVPVEARRFPAEHRGVSPSLQEGGSPGHLCGVTRVSSAGRAPTPRLARPRRGSRPSARPSPASTGTWGTSPIRATFLVAHIAR
jgi:hypothetical protein